MELLGNNSSPVSLCSSIDTYLKYLENIKRSMTQWARYRRMKNAKMNYQFGVEKYHRVKKVNCQFIK